MSSYQIIVRTGHKLLDILWEAFQQDPAVSNIVQDQHAIVFMSPAEAAKMPGCRLSLWLFEVNQNEVGQQPMAHLRTTLPAAPPLPLELHYLITPLAGPGTQGDDDQVLLAKVLEVLHAHPVIILDEATDGAAGEIRLDLLSVTTEEMTRLWQALMVPYRLSVCYRARVTVQPTSRDPLQR